MIALLIGGTLVLCAGVLAVVFGIPVKEFSFGNTMILAGTVGACTGLILIALYVVAREVRALAGRLAGDTTAKAPTLPPVVSSRTRPIPEVAAPAPMHEPRAAERKEDMLFTRDQDALGTPAAPESVTETEPLPLPPLPSAGPASMPSPLSWTDPPARPRSQERSEGRRDIMFSSRRRERPPETEADTSEFSSPADTPESNVPADTPPTFESAWPERAEPARPASEPSRERVQPPRRAEAASVTVVKSGVVDSMAYSLYSDGSIEAQMPEGMVRFASIDELRAHLDQRG